MVTARSPARIRETALPLKARFHAGTDVGMIGVWDAVRGAEPFLPNELTQLSESLDAEANAGHLFVVRTDGNGVTPVDVFIDEPIPADIAAAITPLGDEPLMLSISSGSLMVDGVESYRPKTPDSARAERAVAISPGDYLLRCYVAKPSDEQKPPRSDQELEAHIGAENMRYYERVTRSGCLTGLMVPLLLPALWPFVGPRTAVIVTIVAFFGYFSLREILLRRNTRFTELRERISTFRRRHDEPTHMIELRSVNRALPAE